MLPKLIALLKMLSIQKHQACPKGQQRHKAGIKETLNILRKSTKYRNLTMFVEHVFVLDIQKQKEHPLRNNNNSLKSDQKLTRYVNGIYIYAIRCGLKSVR